MTEKKRRPKIKLSNRIKEYRLKAGLTQRGLGGLVGVNQTSVRQWEEGICLPTLPNLKKLTKIFKCDHNDLIFYSKKGIEE